MATDDSSLKTEVEEFAGHVSDTVLSRAKRHIRAKKSIEDDSFDWYSSVYREEALFWWTCLFAKVSTGELDSQSIAVGAIDVDTLLAKDDEEVTQWFRKANSAMRNIDTGGDHPHGTGITSPTREDREYGGDDTAGLDL
jgi:hypothetical protein